MLRPVDIPVLLRLTLADAVDLSYQQLVIDLGTSEAHAAADRARLSELLRFEGRNKLVNG